MKIVFTSLFTFLLYNFSHAQCSELFFSEYIEGWSNNKALEIYNPTAEPIDLSSYSISRYTNGAVQASTPQQLEGTIDAYSTFVVGLDKRDPEGTGYDAPMWDGYYTYVDSITNQEVTVYDSESDLQSLIDFWANGVYYSGTDPDSAAMYPNTMFFNGNDAITLDLIGFGVIDLIGKVGDDPGAGWTDGNGAIWTKDHTLIRKEDVAGGITGNPVVFDPTIEWDSLPANTFVNLGSHDCVCDNSSTLEDIKSSFSVYPNPNYNQTIKIKNQSDIHVIRLYNFQGQLLSNQKVNGVKEIEIHKPQTSGIGFIELEDSQGTKRKSIVF